MTETADTNQKRAPRVFEPSMPAIVRAAAEHLGEPWAWNADDHRPRTPYLINHPDGRAIGLRLIWNGKAIQAFAVGVPPLTIDNEQEAEHHAMMARHLSPGSRYSAGVTLTADTSPSQAVIAVIDARLLPAFEGERPKLRAHKVKARKSKTTDTADTAAQNAEPNKRSAKGKTEEQKPTDAQPRKAADTRKPTPAKTKRPKGAQPPSGRPAARS